MQQDKIKQASMSPAVKDFQSWITYPVISPVILITIWEKGLMHVCTPEPVR